MTFVDKLKSLMKDLDLTQSKLSELTGIGKSSISQYLLVKMSLQKSAKSKLPVHWGGVQETYFEMFEPAATVQHDDVVNLPVTLAAKQMKVWYHVISESHLCDIIPQCRIWRVYR